MKTVFIIKSTAKLFIEISDATASRASKLKRATKKHYSKSYRSVYSNSLISLSVISNLGKLY